MKEMIILKMLGWVFNRAKEPSTQAGAVSLVSLLAYWVSPEMAEQIVVTAGSIVSLIAMIHAEKNKLPDIKVTHEKD